MLLPHDHIDLLVTAAATWDLELGTEPAEHPLGKRILRAAREPDVVGALLIGLNVRAFRDRYIPATAAHEPARLREFEGEAGEYASAYTYRPVHRTDLVPLHVLAAVRAWRYQCLDAENYRETLAWRFSELIRSAAEDELPGMDLAPLAWTRTS
ncbi:hypothetical protein [Luteimicrobium sp. DT211]|uniref:hypothetical protein n=1 Tax=Luteimicrobium sp. DT211 TaxID=3393412 RepID=UPI003CF00E77